MASAIAPILQAKQESQSIRDALRYSAGVVNSRVIYTMGWYRYAFDGSNITNKNYVAMYPYRCFCGELRKNSGWADHSR